MTLTELRYVAALVQERHFGRAAALCHVSQPTLSIAIKKLEQSLGSELFERTKKGIRPTPLGERVAEKAREILARSAELDDIIASGREPVSGPLALGVLPSVGPYLLPQFIPLLQRLAPHMPLLLQENTAGRLANQLSTGELDVVITTLPFSAPDVVTQPLFDEPFMALVPAGHPLASQRFVEPAALAPAEVLLMAEGDALREQVLAAFPHLRMPVQRSDARGPGVQGTTLEMLRHMVATGLGVTVVPLSAAQTNYYSDEILVARPFVEPAPSRTLALSWRASFPRHQAVDVLRKAILTSSAAYWRYATGRETAASILVENKNW